MLLNILKVMKVKVHAECILFPNTITNYVLNCTYCIFCLIQE